MCTHVHLIMHVYTHSHAHARTRMHTHIHTNTHTYTRTRAHTRTQTHTNSYNSTTTTHIHNPWGGEGVTHLPDTHTGMPRVHQHTHKHTRTLTTTTHTHNESSQMISDMTRLCMTRPFDVFNTSISATHQVPGGANGRALVPSTHTGMPRTQYTFPCCSSQQCRAL